MAAAELGGRRAGESSLLLGARDPSIPPLPLVLALAVAAGCALSLPRLRVRARRVSQSMRFGGAFLALLVPAMAMYPSLSAFAIQAKERLIATEYGLQAASMRDDLQQRLFRALEQIDELPGLPELVTAPADDDTTTNRAFAVWSSTDLETIPGDISRRALRERRAAPQPFRAPSSRIRGAAVPGRRMRLGPDRRCLADWRERIARAAREPRRLRRQSSGSARSSSRPCSTTARCRSLPRGVRISSLSGRIARFRRKAYPGGTSSSSFTDGAAPPCSRRARASGRFPMRSSSAWWSRARRCGPASSAAASGSASTS